MNAILKALHSSDIAEAAEASRAFCLRAKQAGKDPQSWYAELMTAKSAMGKIAKRSAVSFEDLLLGPKSVAKRVKDAEEDDDMSDEERKRRGISAAARGEDGEDAEPDSDPDDKDEDDVKVKRGGSLDRSKVRRSVSFVDKIFSNESRVFPIEEQEQARQPRRVDTGEDALGRSYADGVLERLGGGLTGSRGDVSSVPLAGKGETWEGDATDVPNSGFRPLANQDDAMVGGAERPYTPSNPGRDGAYKLEAEGLEPGAGVVRVGPNFVLPGKSGGEGLSAPFIALESSHKILKSEDGPVKSEDRKGLFRSVLNEDAMKPFDGRA